MDSAPTPDAGINTIYPRGPNICHTCHPSRATHPEQHAEQPTDSAKPYYYIHHNKHAARRRRSHQEPPTISEQPTTSPRKDAATGHAGPHSAAHLPTLDRWTSRRRWTPTAPAQRTQEGHRLHHQTRHSARISAPPTCTASARTRSTAAHILQTASNTRISAADTGHRPRRPGAPTAGPEDARRPDAGKDSRRAHSATRDATRAAKQYITKIYNIERNY